MYSIPHSDKIKYIFRSHLKSEIIFFSFTPVKLYTLILLLTVRAIILYLYGKQWRWSMSWYMFADFADSPVLLD